MADNWVAEVTVGTITHTATAPNTVFADGGAPPQYIFAALDSPTNSAPAIRISRRIHSYGGGPTIEYQMYEEHGFANTSGDPGASFVAVGGGTYQTADGTNGTTFLSGGTISIEKDETGSQYIWHGILGTTTQAFGGGVIAGELAPDKLRAQNSNIDNLSNPLNPFSPIVSSGTSLSIPFSNFYGSQNATQIKGATLGSTDRGSWLGGSVGYVPWIVSITGSATLPNADTGSEVVAGIDTTSNAPDFAAEYRAWDQSVYLPGMDPGNEAKLDSIHTDEHAIHWLAYVLTGSTDTLSWKRSHDKFVSSSSGTLYSFSGSRNNSPNIAWAFGKLVAIWHDGTNILISFSTDLAETWSAAVALSITGTNPRLIMNPKTGFAWLFYIDAGKLYVQRSGNFFAEVVDGSPILVVDPIEKQSITAQLALDDSLVINYVASGSVTQARSTDLGRTWSA